MQVKAPAVLVIQQQLKHVDVATNLLLFFFFFSCELRGLAFTIALQAEKVWQWYKSPGGALGLIRNTNKSCRTMIHSHSKAIHMGTSVVPVMSFWMRSTHECVLCYTNKAVKKCKIYEKESDYFGILISSLESVKVQRFIFISAVGAAGGLAQIKGLPAVEAFFSNYIL